MIVPENDIAPKQRLNAYIDDKIATRMRMHLHHRFIKKGLEANISEFIEEALRRELKRVGA